MISKIDINIAQEINASLKCNYFKCKIGIELIISFHAVEEFINDLKNDNTDELNQKITKIFFTELHKKLDNK